MVKATNFEAMYMVLGVEGVKEVMGIEGVKEVMGIEGVDKLLDWINSHNSHNSPEKTRHKECLGKWLRDK